MELKEIIMKKNPYYYQREALDSIFTYFNRDDASHPLITLPTGSGKSLLQAMIAEKILKDYNECRILFITHQQELIFQSYSELLDNLQDNLFIDAGIYSAGLNRRDVSSQILFAGIQSVYKKAEELGAFNLIVVDECHLIPKKGFGMYKQFISKTLEIAPYCKIIGLTATPYRTDSGLLTDGDDKIFDEIIYNISVSKLVSEKYLCNLIGRAGIIEPDTSGVHLRGGEFIENELNQVCNDSKIIEKAVEEIIKLTENRNHVLIFCVGIEHAENVVEEFIKQNQNCAAVHSKLPDDIKENVISDFRNKKLKYICNVDMLTTGFNARHIDCIVLLRPTMSTGLYYQMCGRGLRLHEEKENCLILDYAGNIFRHGAIDKIEIITTGKPEERGVKKAPMKKCPECNQPIHAAIMECPFCNHIFKSENNIKHNSTAANADPLSKYIPSEELQVESVYYYLHEKNGNHSMRVSYQITPTESVSEWICIEHGGFAEKKAREWLRIALPKGHPIPDTVEECLNLKNVYKIPECIFVDYNEKFPRIISKIYPVENTVAEKIENVFSERSFVR